MTKTEYIPVGHSASFSNGILHINGQPQTPAKVQTWRSSNGLTIYTAVDWFDPITGEHRCSCNCNGWAIAKPGKNRSCCHVDDMMGIKVCRKQKVDSQELHTVAQVMAIVPNVKDERQLRRMIKLD